MLGDIRIREALERCAKAVSNRPAIARKTATTRAVLHPGLACTISEGPYEFQIGMTEKYGGTAGGPTPGVLGRGALASCLAVGYGMWAARLGVPFEALEVEVHADFDARAELGVAEDVRPGYLEVRYTVTVVTSSPDADVLRVLDTAERCSSYHDIFAHGVPLKREVHINAGQS